MKIFKSKNVLRKDSKKEKTSQKEDFNSSIITKASKNTHANETQDSTNLNNKETLISEDTNNKKEEAEPLLFKRYFKPTVNKKLTIILLENTPKVATEKEKLLKLIKSLSSSGLVKIINYDSNVRQSEIFKETDFLSSKNIEGKTCLFDALVELENLVCSSYMKVEEKEDEDIKITNIDVIGIGTCSDNGSKVSKKTAIDCFLKVARKPKITTKYFCLTEEAFIQAAEIGFNSIGSIFRNYQ